MSLEILSVISMCDLFPTQQAVSSLLFECVFHVPEVGQTVHGAREALIGHQRSQEGNMTS